jgi:hypothetical protein
MAFDAQNYIDAVERWRLKIEVLESTSAADLERLMVRINREIAKLLDFSGPINDQSRAEVISRVRGLLNRSLAEALKIGNANLVDTMLATWERDVAALGRIPSARQALATFQNFEDGIRAGQLFPRVRRGILGKWSGEFVEYWQPVVREVQSAIVRGQIAGMSGNAIARTLENSLGSVRGGTNAQVFSRMLVRTKMTEAAADLSQEMAAEADIDKFANIGTPDDRQAEECYEASQQEPMTWPEWMEWTASNGKGGPAPRHPNCRCSMAPVPDALAEDDWTQPNPKFEEEGATV